MTLSTSPGLSLDTRRTPTKLAARVLSPSEFSELEALFAPTTSRTNHSNAIAMETEEWIRFLAPRWAVKETAYKALSPTTNPLGRSSPCTRNRVTVGNRDLNSESPRMGGYMSRSATMGSRPESRMYWLEISSVCALVVICAVVAMRVC